MPEMTASTGEAARRLGVSDTAIHKTERAGCIAREPDGNCDIDKTRRRLTETADPIGSQLAKAASPDGTPTGSDILRYLRFSCVARTSRLRQPASIWCGAHPNGQSHPCQPVEAAGTGVAAR